MRVVGEGITPGIYSTPDALRMAQERGVDLVEISGKVNPPVCKLIDYSKFKYEQKKREKQIKAKSQKVVMKEIRLSPNTDDHDFSFKAKHAGNFLKEGAKVKVQVKFAGRQIMFKERGEAMLLRFAQELEELGKVEVAPKMEGRRMNMMLAPKQLPKKQAPTTARVPVEEPVTSNPEA